VYFDVFSFFSVVDKCDNLVQTDEATINAFGVRFAGFEPVSEPEQ
jgi:hypothetical protein